MGAGSIRITQRWNSPLGWLYKHHRHGLEPNRSDSERLNGTAEGL